MSGLVKACEKRPVSVSAMERCCGDIERILQEYGEKEVPSSRLGDAVMEALRELDDVAYLRFASVYLSYRDLEELLNEVQRFMGKKNNAERAEAHEDAHENVFEPATPTDAPSETENS